MVREESKKRFLDIANSVVGYLRPILPDPAAHEFGPGGSLVKVIDRQNQRTNAACGHLRWLCSR